MKREPQAEDALKKAKINIKKPVLTLPSPLAETFFLHPSNLRLKIDTSELWWMEKRNPRQYPTMAGGWETAEGCLDAFFRLHDASDEQILEFAERWGILGIWPLRRKKPNPNFTENTDSRSLRRDERRDEDMPNTGNSPNDIWTVESTDLWRRLARHFRALLLLAADLRSQGTGTDEVWGEIIDNVEESRAAWTMTAQIGTDPSKQERFSLYTPAARHIGKTFEQAYRDEMWGALLHVLDRWAKQVPIFLNVSNLRANGGVVSLDFNQMPTNWDAYTYAKCERQGQREWAFTNDFAFYGEDPYTPMRSSILLNVLVVQLIGAITSGIYVCQSCQQPFSSVRKPRLDKTVLCDRDECAAAQSARRVAKSRRKRAEARSEE